jgi:fibronectin type 3 domain-containing protein/uncharacterized ParB-like nuclease family protein
MSERVGNEARFLFTSQIQRINLTTKTWSTAVTLPRSGATAMTGDAQGGYVAYGANIYRYGAGFTGESALATASSSVHGLFLDGDLLIAVHSTGLYARLTAYHRTTGTQLSTRETYVDSLYGASHAPGLNRIFGRSQGVSPADIVAASYTDAGVIANAADSFYHGDYPSATRTWVFPGESRVVDSSGNVYSADGLVHAGSMAGTVTDIAFNGDVPVVLRGSEVIAFTNTLLEVGRAPAGTATGAALHVTATEALVFSPGTSRPEMQAVPLSSLNAPAPYTPIDPNGLPYQVNDAFVDKDGNLLIFSTAQMSLFRWSPTLRRYTASLPLLGQPKFFAYSAENHAAYFAYQGQMIRKMDLTAATPVETPLLTLPFVPTAFTTAGQYLYSVAGSSIRTFTPDGTVLTTASSGSNWGSQNTWDPVKRRVYHFRDSTSPNDLHYDTLGSDGRLAGSGESPYHGDFTALYPIRVSPDGGKVVIGSGVVFETAGLTMKANLANGFTDATWVGNKLVTIRLINGITQVQTWEGEQFLAGPVVRQFNGTPLRIFSTAEGLVVMTSSENTPRFILLNGALDTLFISPTKPATPLNPVVTARDQQSVTLAWQDASDNEDGFRVEYRTGAGAWTPGPTAAANATTITVADLPQGTVHEFRMIATTGDLLSAPSATVSGRTTNGPDEPVGEPYLLAVTRAFHNRITLEWQDNASNETGFRVLRSTSAAGTPVVLMAAANATSFTDTSLAANTTYYYRVQVVNGTIEGDLSAQVNRRTLSSAVAPSAPSSLSAVATGPALVTLAWTDNSSDEEQFIIERSSNPATTWSELGRDGYNVKTFADSTAVPDTAYSYRVRASNSTGVSANTTATVKTPKLGGEFTGHSIRSGSIQYFAFTSPHRIERYDLVARQWLAPVPLQAAATAIWADEAGIYVAEDRAVIRFAPDGSGRTALANAQSSVKALFTLGDTLAFQNGSDVTTLGRSTGLILATFGISYSGGGFSVAPGTRTAYFRTTGVSPSDIRLLQIGADGKLLRSADSPYHGDYPTATRTFVFPNGARVADESGTVYSTDTLTYNNSLGGSFTDLAFHGVDVPIVLRSDKLIAYGNTLLESGSFTLPAPGLRVAVSGTDAIVFSVSGQSASGLSVQIVPLSQLSAPVPGTPVDPRGLAYTPDEVFVDKDGAVLLFSKSQLSLFRWSPSEGRYLSTVPLVGAPNFAAYSAQNHAAYFAYGSQVVRKLDLAAATPVETPLFNLAAAPSALTTAGEFIYAVTSGNIQTFTPEGSPLTNSGFTYYTGNHNTWDPVNRRVYHFRDGSSPNDLLYDTVASDGRITGGADSPYHGDFTVLKPIRVSPDGSRIVIGSGVVFNATGLTKVASLANSFTDAAWHGGRLVTARLINGVTQLQTWTEPQFVAGADIRQVSGTPVRLLPIDAARLLLVTQIDGVPRFTIFNTALEATYVSPAKPLPPTGLAVAGRTAGSVTLDWVDASDNEDGFRVEYRTGTGEWITGATTAANTTRAIVSGLPAGIAHEFRVTAFSLDLVSAPSTPVTALTLTGPDQPVGEPYGLRVTRIFNNQITLEWQDNATNETGFRVTRSSSPTGATTSFTAPAGSTAYTLTGLTASTTYYFRVQAVNGAIAGDLSGQVSATTLASSSSPTAPSQLAVAAKTATTVSLTWRDNSTNEETFAVERSSSPASTWTTIASLPYNSAAYTDTTAVPNTAYSYRIRAVNPVGSAVSSTVTTTTTKLGGDFGGHSIRSGDLYYFAFTGPNRIERYDLASRSWLAPVALSAPATALWADEYGIYVAEDRAVSRFAPDGSARTPMGNGETTVNVLFTLKDVLVFGPSGGQLTSLHKKTGLFFSNFGSGYGAGGISVAPLIDRAFYRTTGVSPSDIGYMQVGADGKLVKSDESPYHGSYPSASRTFVFPDSGRVADSSGTVYSTDSLTYTNSLGTAFTDLDFRGRDVPIVLRGNKLHSYSNTLLEAGSYTLPAAGLRVAVAGSDALVFTADGTNDRGLAVTVVPLTLLSAPEPGNAIDPRGLPFTPDDMFLDKDGNLLLFSRSHLSLFRWSTRERQYLPALALIGSPLYAAYSKQTHRAYFAYESQVIRGMDLNAAAPVETPLFNLPTRPNGLSTAGEFVFSADGSGAWGSHYVHSPAGAQLSAVDWNYDSRVWEWDPVKRRMYFFRDDTSPNDLHWEGIDATGKIVAEGETPYHGDFTVSPPIRVSPDGSKVVIGGGALFETTGMTRMTTLANSFVDAAWRGNNEILTISANGTATQLQRWIGSTFASSGSSTLFQGTPHRIFALADGGFCLVTLVSGMPRYRLLDANLTLIYDYLPNAPRVSGTPPVASEDTMFAWTPATWQIAGSGTLTLTAPVLPSWLTFSGGVIRGTPAEVDSGDQVDRSKTHRIVLRIQDGAGLSEEREFLVTVHWRNDAPWLPLAFPEIRANDRGESTVTDFKPQLVDPDGRDVHRWEVTGNTHPSIFSGVSFDEAGRLTLDYAPYVDGTSTLTLAATDASGASVVRSVEVVLPELPLPLVTASPNIRFSRLTGLYEQSVTVTNVAQRAIAGFDLALSGLRDGVILYNGTNAAPGSAGLSYHLPMAAGESVTLVLEYHAALRGEIPAPTIVPTLATPAAGAVAQRLAAADAFEINRSLKLQDGSFLIEFNAEVGKTYRVEYSTEGTAWKRCPVAIRAGGTKVQWIDRGPPWTESAPSTQPRRLYRVTRDDG